MSNKRESLLEAQDGHNPFELLQTIDLPPDSPADQHNPFAVAAPKRASAAVRNRKNNRKNHNKPRKSAPVQSTNNNTTNGNVNQEEDLLNLFGDMSSASNNNNSNNNNNNMSNGNSPVQNAQPTPNLTNFSSYNSNASDFDFLNMPNASDQPRPSGADPDPLFDTNMWGNMGSGSNDFLNTTAEQHNTRASAPVIRPLTQVKKSTPGLTSVSEEKNGYDDDDDDDDNDDDDSSDTEDDDEVGDLPDNRDTLGEPVNSPRRHSAPAGDVIIDSKTKKKSSNALFELHRGTALLKYPRRHGFPHFKHVQLGRDNSRLQWFSKRKSLNDTCILIRDIREVLQGQKTEVFKKFRQEMLEKASFSIVYGHDYKTFDVVAKSTDECDLWVKALRLLQEMTREGRDIANLQSLDVGVRFKDRSRPRSRRGSGNFVRSNNSRQLKIDPIAKKQVEREMEALHRSYHKVTQLSQRPNITRSAEFYNIQQVLSELEERIEELTHEVSHTRDTEMSKRDVWRANVDLTAIQEKIEVIYKYFDADGRPKY